MSDPLDRTPDWLCADVIARLLESGRTEWSDPRDGTLRSILLDDRPCFLACGIFRPHLPWRIPAELLPEIAPDSIAFSHQLQSAARADLFDLPRRALKYTDFPNGLDEPAEGRFPDLLVHGGEVGGEGGDLRASREAVRHYLLAVMHADRCVGRLLDALDRSPRRDRTVVVLWSDHGWHLGTKYHFGKSTLWEDSAACVLIVKDPRHAASARRHCNAPVNLIDLYPTLCALAGVAPPCTIAGHDLGPLLVSPDAPWKTVSLTSSEAGFDSITDGRYRYIRNGDRLTQREFYDHATDPEERTNLATKASARPIVERLEQALRQALAPRDRAGTEPDPHNDE